MPAEPDIDALIAIPPVTTPVSVIETDNSDLTITVEGKPRPLIPAWAIAGLAIFGAAAFICPGVFLVFVVLLPIGLLGAGGIYLFAPHLLDRPVDTQMLRISHESLTLTESCPRKQEAGDDTDAETTTIGRDDIESTRLIEPGGERTAGLHIRTSSGETIVFGTPLVTPPYETSARDAWEELEWLAEIIHRTAGVGSSDQ